MSALFLSNFRHSIAAPAAVFLFGVLPVVALAAPDAGSILQRFESRPERPLAAPSRKKPKAPTPPSSGASTKALHVNAFRIEGNQLLSTDTLQLALAGFTGTDLSLTQLQEVAWVIIQTYREAGWLVHAFVPPQEIDQGIVKIQVIEAKLGQVHIDFPKEASLPIEHIQAMADAQLSRGATINLNEVDRFLLLIDDIPGVFASASYAEGVEQGSTDIRVQLGQRKQVETQIMLDNFGAVSTGSTRLSANVTVNNGLGLGDALAMQASISDGSTYARAAYTLPVGLEGWRTGVHISQLNYNLVGSFAALDASGNAQTWGADITAPLLRSPDHNLNLQINTDHKSFDNQALSNSLGQVATVSKYQIDVVRSGLNANWMEQGLTPAQNSASVLFTLGHVNLADSPNAAADNISAHTGGHFQKINLGYNREQSISGQATAYMQAGAQLADRNLDSSEKIYLGGATGVRAYPSNEAGGSNGYTLTVGLKHRLDPAWTLNGFVDWGRIQLYANNLNAAGSEITSTNTQTLQGFGLSASWRDNQGLEITATWSRRQGFNSGANATTGADSDGTHIVNRLWLSTALNF